MRPCKQRDLRLVPGFRQFCGQFRRPRKMGQGNQERLDLYAGKAGGQRENALQNGPALNQAAGAGLAFLIALLGGAVFVHIAFSFGGFIQPRLI